MGAGLLSAHGSVPQVSLALSELLLSDLTRAHRSCSLPDGGVELVRLRVKRKLARSSSGKEPVQTAARPVRLAPTIPLRPERTVFVSSLTRPSLLEDAAAVVSKPTTAPPPLASRRTASTQNSPKQQLPATPVRIKSPQTKVALIQPHLSELGASGRLQDPPLMIGQPIESEKIVITVGLARLLTTRGGVLTVGISNPTVIDARPVRVRHIVVNGLQVGLSSLWYLEERIPGDKVGVLRQYVVEVVPVVTTTADMPIVRVKKPEDVADEIRQAIGDARIQVHVFVDKDEKLAAVLKGEVEKEREAKIANAITLQFVSTVTSNINFTEPEQPVIPVQMSDDLKLTLEIQEETGLTGIRARKVGSNIILFGEVANADEATAAIRVARARGAVTPALKIVGGATPQGRSSFLLLPEAELTAKEQEATTFIRSVTQLPNVVVREFSSKFYLLGKVKNQEEYDSVRRAIEAYSNAPIATQAGGGGTSGQGGLGQLPYVNFLEIEEGGVVRQVTIQAHVVELAKSLTKELGIQWGGEMQRGAVAGNVITPQPDFGRLTVGEPGPGIGGFTRLQRLIGRINMLQDDSRARILSAPNETTLDRTPAWIQIGGSFPILSTTIGGGGAAGFATQTIEFVPFGIILVIRPEVTPDKKIVLKIQARVSQPDFSLALTVAGARIPGLRERAAESILLLQPGESIVIGGLIDRSDSKSVQRIPILSSLPVIGQLFQSRSFQRGETELMIFITPQLIEVPAGPGAMDIAGRSFLLPPLPTINPLGNIGSTSSLGGIGR